MKKLFLLLLALCLWMSLCACNQTQQEQTGPSEPTGPTTSVSAYKSEGNFEKLQGQLTWEKINAFPIKSSDMTTDEMRDLCVDFLRFSKTALWVADDNFPILNSAGEVARSVEKGVVYGGLPYVGVASGNVYRLMDYMDEETGVVNVKAAGENQELFGNQCSICAWWGWARVINSVDFKWTYDCVTSRGFPYVGERLYKDDLKRFTTSYGTDEVMKENDMQKIFECYAQLKAGDGIMYMTTAGHVVMISGDAVVERTASGAIDPSKSYVTVLDQTTQWVTGTNEFGESYTYEANVDAKWTFMSLYEGNYVPFTYKEFLGEDPVEETEISFSHTGDTINKYELYRSYVSCNYSLVDAYAIVRDSKGNEVLKVASRAHQAGMKDLRFVTQESEKTLFEWGAWESLSKKEKYTLEIIAQVGTGERPSLWKGKLELV